MLSQSQHAITEAACDHKGSMLLNCKPSKIKYFQHTIKKTTENLPWFSEDTWADQHLELIILAFNTV